MHLGQPFCLPVCVRRRNCGHVLKQGREDCDRKRHPRVCTTSFVWPTFNCMQMRVGKEKEQGDGDKVARAHMHHLSRLSNSFDTSARDESSRRKEIERGGQPHTCTNFFNSETCCSSCLPSGMVPLFRESRKSLGAATAAGDCGATISDAL